MSTLFVDTINEKTSGNGIYIPGHVVQVVNNTHTTQISTSTFVDVGVATSITPKSSSSKILVMATAQVNQTHPSNLTVYGHFELYRGDSSGTNIFDGQSAELVAGPSTQEHGVRWHTHVLDSPATTSSTTYTLYYRPQSGSTHIVNRNTSPAIMTLMEIAQ